MRALKINIVESIKYIYMLFKHIVKVILKPPVRILLRITNKNKKVSAIVFFIINKIPSVAKRIKRQEVYLEATFSNVRTNEKATRYTHQDHLLPQTGRIFYFYVDYTVKSPANSGLERVARMLARSLIELGLQVRFVKWSDRRSTLVYINREELLHLEKWSGPTLAKDDMARYSEDRSSGDDVSIDILQKHWLKLLENVEFDVIVGLESSGFHFGQCLQDRCHVDRLRVGFFAAVARLASSAN